MSSRRAKARQGALGRKEMPSWSSRSSPWGWQQRLREERAQRRPSVSLPFFATRATVDYHLSSYLELCEMRWRHPHAQAAGAPWTTGVLVRAHIRAGGAVPATIPEVVLRPDSAPSRIATRVMASLSLLAGILAETVPPPRALVPRAPSRSAAQRVRLPNPLFLPAFRPGPFGTGEL